MKDETAAKIGVVLIVASAIITWNAVFPYWESAENLESVLILTILGAFIVVLTVFTMGKRPREVALNHD